MRFLEVIEDAHVHIVVVGRPFEPVLLDEAEDCVLTFALALDNRVRSEALEISTWYQAQ